MKRGLGGAAWIPTVRGSTRPLFRWEERVVEMAFSSVCLASHFGHVRTPAKLCPLWCDAPAGDRGGGREVALFAAGYGRVGALVLLCYRGFSPGGVAAQWVKHFN
ncbi:hypothetical protein L484_018492 [Morus notabilis]|uniref:Uncharacterized protein n=1 Tax=Morus notabilis TaxID=981085 RepID=W9S3M8_9ROSA|nr:hypothetical protein L484_018492 [Morus notabilis]